MSFAGIGLIIGLLIFLFSRGSSRKKPEKRGLFPSKPKEEREGAARFIPAGGASSERFGYSFTLLKQGWYTWPQANGQVSGGAARRFGEDGGLMLLPAVLDDAPLNNETLAAAFFAAAGPTLKDANNGVRRAINCAGLPGTQFDFKTVRNGKDEVWRARILRGQRLAYFMAAFVDKSAEAKFAAAAEPLETLAITEPQQMPELNAQEKQFQRYFFNDAGIHCLHQGDNVVAVQLFRKSLALDNDTTVLANLCAAAERAGMHQAGYDAIQKGAPNRLGTPELLGYQARFEQQLGRLDDAEETFRALFAGGFDHDDAFRDFAGLLWRRGKKEEAYSLASDRAAKLRTDGARLLLASMEAETDPDKALATIDLVLKEDPGHVRALIQKTETLADAGRYPETLAEARSLLERGYDYPYVHFLKGRGELGMSLLREAQQSLETARKGMPNDEGVILLQERVAGLLGQGSRAVLKDPLEPVPLPEPLAQVFGAEPAAFDPGVHQAYYALVSRVHQFRKNERFKTTDYSLLKITGPEGARMYTVFQFTVDPLTERVYVNELTVTGPDGTVTRGDQESYFVMDDSSRGMASHRQILHIPVPGVVPGAVVKLVMTREHAGLAAEMPYRIETLSCRVPALMSTVTLSGAVEAAQIELPPGAELIENTKERITYNFREPEPAVVEGFCPPYLETLPVYRMGPRGRSWQDAAGEYSERVAREFDAPGIKELAARLSEGAASETEKLARVLGFLQNEIRYIAIEFGSRGIEPASPQETITRKYGDCKDQAVLGTALLRAAGVRAWPALVSTEARIAESMPSLDQFNHMVIFADVEGGRFADSTQRYHDPRLLVPPGLGGRTALVLKETPELAVIPKYARDSSGVRVTRTIERSGDMLLVQETAHLHGYFAGSMRGFLAAVNAEVHAMALQDLLVSSGVPLRVKSVAVQGLESPFEPLVLETAFERPHGFISGNTPAVLPFLSWESYLIEVRGTGVRRHLFELPYPTAVHTESTYRIAGAREEEVSGSNAYAAYSMAVRPAPGGFVLLYRCDANPLQGPPQEFAAASAFSLEATSMLHRPIVVA